VAAARPWSGDPRRRLVAVGLAAIVLHVGITTLAVTGLARVEEAHAAVESLDTAKSYFQDADMAHDAVQADAAELAMHVDGRLDAPDSRVELAASMADFRQDLVAVDEVGLPPALTRRVAAVRPLQERYLATADRMLLAQDGAAALAAYRETAQRADELVDEQDDVTRAMDVEADRLRAAARRDERMVGVQLVLSALGALGALVGITVLLSRMGRDLSALLARERGVAETLQHSLLPERLPELPGVQLAARYAPGAVESQVGGDWYDVVPLPGGRVGLVMGDVVGHDLRAAASMGQLRNALRACAADGTAPDEVLQRLNHLCVTQDLGDMASVLYAVLDPVQGVVEVANAGHLPPLLVSADDSCYLEARPSPPVGVVREAQFTSTTWALPAGSLLLLYTDGLVERRGSALQPALERLQTVLEAGRATPIEQLCDDVMAGMLGAGASADDDVALLLVAPQAVLGPRVEVTWPAKADRLALLRHLLERWLAEAGAQDDEAYDVLVASSEAATNAVEHAYGPAQAEFRVVCCAEDGGVTVLVRDWGTWREPRGRDRGRGLGLMEGLMDDVKVSHSTSGTEVRMHRRLRSPAVVAAGAVDRQALTSP
jgi:serine phosphatase RsbU (regulator of sigma subunit)/anti-sigma regulatory factor (Ser/Thr protein kinase)